VSSGELVLVGIATAVGTIALALMLSRIVHVIVAAARTGGNPGVFPRAQPVLARRARASQAASARPPAPRAGTRVAERRVAARETRPAAARAEASAAMPTQPALQTDSGDSRPVEEPRAAPPVEPPAPSHPEVPSVRISPERSIDVKRLRQSVDPGEPAGQPGRGVDGDTTIADESAAYRQVGEDVAEVLTAAERTAARIRASARQEADQIRADAEQSAAATVASAEARQAKAEKYDHETRAAADAYAEATRRKSDEEAAARISEAEERAREIRARADVKAREIEAGAIRRRDALVKTTEGMEDRIKSMLRTFRDAATDLEDLLPAEETDGADGAERPADDDVAEALKPTVPQS
jgi:hypothetical protein